MNNHSRSGSQIFNLSSIRGHQSVFQPGQYSLNWLGLESLCLETGESWQDKLGDEEAALVILSGRCTISVNGEAWRWERLGSRESIFSGPATTVYAPRRSALNVIAESNVEVAIAKARCEVDLSPMLVAPGDVKIVSSGVSNWRRDVRLIIPPGSPISQRLIVGETLNPPGNWSGIPPHKHDEISGTENFLEEFYFYKTKPADGYGVQLVYHKDAEQAHMIGDDDVMVFLSGYHPTVAAPGTTICYLWALAGDSKAYNVVLDPRFGWVSTAEAVIKEMQH